MPPSRLSLRVTLNVLFNILGCDFECSITRSVTLVTCITGDGTTGASYASTSTVSNAASASPADAKSVLNGRCLRLCARHPSSVARTHAHTHPISRTRHSRARCRRAAPRVPFYPFPRKNSRGIESRAVTSTVDRRRRPPTTVQRGTRVELRFKRPVSPRARSPRAMRVANSRVSRASGVTWANHVTRASALARAVGSRRTTPHTITHGRWYRSRRVAHARGARERLERRACRRARESRG